jgi:ribose transport system permease protein
MSSPRRSLREQLSVRNIGAIYVWIAIVILFALVAPDTFPTAQTAKAILNQYSITGIVALSLVIPLAAGFYDLSIGYTLGLSGILAAYLLQETAMSPLMAGTITIAACVAIGLLNAFVVVGLGVNSFIGTLGTGAVLASITIAISGDQTITGRIGEDFAKIASTEWQGISLPVLYLLVLVIALAWWLERTRMGRSFYAMGFEREAARLSGIKIDRLGTIAFVTSAVIAGFAGMVLAGRVSSASPEAGPAYLIPAFSAAFLGATQLRQGRFNAWGTVIAVLLLGTGNVGLLLAGGPIWTPQLFEGVVLIAAVALTVGAGASPVRAHLAALWQRVRGERSRGQPASEEG